MIYGFARIVNVILVLADGSTVESTIEADGGLMPQRLVDDSGRRFTQVDATPEDREANRYRWVECPDEYRES